MCKGFEMTKLITHEQDRFTRNNLAKRVREGGAYELFNAVLLEYDGGYFTDMPLCALIILRQKWIDVEQMEERVTLIDGLIKERTEPQ